MAVPDQVATLDASRFLLAATVFLALGLSAEIRVVVSKITENGPLANGLAIATAATLFGFWHVWPCWRRVRKFKAASDSE